VAVGVRTVLALFASGTIVLDALGIGRVHLDLTRLTSSTGNALASSELEAFRATFALVLSWAGASLTRGMASSTGLGLEVSGLSIFVLDLNGGGVFNFVHTPTTGGALAFVDTALLTVRLTLEANLRLLVVEESHSLLVGWALSHAHTDHLSDLLGLALDGSSSLSIGLSEDVLTSIVPDLIDGFVVRHIGSHLIRLLVGKSIHGFEVLGLLGSKSCSQHSS